MLRRVDNNTPERAPENLSRWNSAPSSLQFLQLVRLSNLIILVVTKKRIKGKERLTYATKSFLIDKNDNDIDFNLSIFPPSISPELKKSTAPYHALEPK